jgi:membrane protease subunit (stomatin/prohibitin family)
MAKEWCPKCKYGHHGKFCTECGTPLTERPTCSCGAEQYAYSKFCQNCGKKVEHAK